MQEVFFCFFLKMFFFHFSPVQLNSKFQKIEAFFFLKKWLFYNYRISLWLTSAPVQPARQSSWARFSKAWDPALLLILSQPFKKQQSASEGVCFCCALSLYTTRSVSLHTLTQTQLDEKQKHG